MQKRGNGMNATQRMEQEKVLEGLAYAEQNYCSDDETHLRYDKQLLKETFDLNGKKILDFGCGMGSMLLWYRANWDCEVHGIDIDKNHIQIANKILDKFGMTGISIELKNILLNPLDQKFDFISMNDVVEHIQYPFLENIFPQLEKALNKEGKIFISYPPWQGPFASHVDHAVGFSWCQFLPDKLLLKLIERNNQTLVGEIEHDLVDVYLGLNKITHRKLINLIKKTTNLKVTVRKNHCMLNRISAFKNVNFSWFPFNLLITKEFLVLEHG